MQFGTGYEITKEALKADKDGKIVKDAKIEAKKRMGLAIVERLEELNLLEITPYSEEELKESHMAEGYFVTTDFDISWKDDCERVNF